MRQFYGGVIAKVAVGLLAIAILAWLSFSAVKADIPGWLSSSNPTLTKITDLPSNVSPGTSNRDCINTNYIAVSEATGAQSSKSDCLVRTTRGFMGMFGTPLIGNYSSIGMGVHGYNNDAYLLQPIPNQGMVLSTTSAPVLGNYLHFYTDVSQHFTTINSQQGSVPAAYSVTNAPDFSLRDKNGNLIPANSFGTLSYSSNGSWMVVDAYSRGFLRINLATFEVTPFAPSFNGPNDNNNYTGLTAISDNGRYAVVYSFNFNYFKVYDLSTCTGTTSSDYTQQLNCQYRDYLPFMKSSLGSFRGLFKVRFMNDDNIMLTANNNYQGPTSYTVATYRLTAAGKFAHGIDYLALGDSYISGEGEFIYKAGTDTDSSKCHLSPLSYPFSIGLGLFNGYQSVACSGAATKDITGLGFIDYNTASGGAQSKGKSEPSYDTDIFNNFQPGYRIQLEFVKKYQPTAVTLSIGGNNINFADKIAECASLNSCFDTYDERMQAVRAIDTTYDQLTDTYKKIIEADPGVRLYVTGYPQVAVPNGNCADNVHLNSSEIQFSQQLISYLNWTVQQAAKTAGAQYVDIENALSGHRLCETTGTNVALNGLTAGNDIAAAGFKVIGQESYHPNVLGHQLIGQTVLQQTSNLTQAMPLADSTIPHPSANDPLAQELLKNLVYGNPPVQIAQSDNNFMTNLIVRGSSTNVSLNGQEKNLAPNGTYTITAHSSVTTLGTITADVNGDLSGQVTIPATLDPGFHTIDITGVNRSGETVDFYKVVYIAASDTDYNGDGISNTDQQCLITASSGIDVDQDGIDDACDPSIGSPPAKTYPVTVQLTGNYLIFGQ